MKYQNITGTVVFVAAHNNFEFIGLNREILIELDKWGSAIFPEAEKAHCLKKEFDFTVISSAEIRKEAKEYLLWELSDKGLNLATAMKHLYYIGCANNFLCQEFPYVESVSDLPEYAAERIEEDNPYFSGTKMISRIRNTVLHFRTYIRNKKYPELIPTSPEDEVRQSRIRLDHLGFEIDQNLAQYRSSITLDGIRQDWLREIITTYIIDRLRYRGLSTIIGEITCAKILSDYLSVSGRHIDSLDQFTIHDALNLQSYVGSFGYQPKTYNGHMNGIKNLLAGIYDLGLSKEDNSHKFIHFIPAKEVKKTPKVFTDKEFDFIYQAIADLPDQVMRIVFILISSGWRSSDVLNLKCENPFVEINGQLHIQTVQQKTRRLVSMPCLDESIPEIIRLAIQESKEKFGPDCKYVFAKSKDRPIRYGFVRDKLNAALNSIGAISDNGEPFSKIRLHAFRSTRVTDLVEKCGIEPEVARRIVGQQSDRALEQYVEISDHDFAEKMTPIHNELDEMIRNRGYKKPEAEEEPELANALRLIDGACARPLEAGICEKLGNCFTCKMFHWLKAFLPYYKYMYGNYQRSYKIAVQTGCVLIAEKALQMIEVLEKNIAELEKIE